MTDPDAITAALNDPDGAETLLIYTHDPDVRLLDALLTFQLGPAAPPARCRH